MTSTIPANDQDYANSGWLQAMMGANDPILQQSRLHAKRHLDWIDSICSLTTIREKAHTLESSLDGLWRYAEGNELLWLLTSVPAAQLDWIIDSTDDFMIQQTTPPKIVDSKTWGAAMGIFDWSTEVNMRILSGEFVSWQRRVARQSSGAPVGFTMENSGKAMLELKSIASWKANQWADGQWTFAIVGQPNMEHTVEEPVMVIRPSRDLIEESGLLTIQTMDDRFATVRKKASSGSSGIPNGRWLAWANAVEPLSNLHDQVMTNRDSRYSTTFQGIWATVWPIVYCKRKKLPRGACGLTELRKRLDICFQSDAALVTWMFVFSELMYQSLIGDGLGISAKFKHE